MCYTTKKPIVGGESPFAEYPQFLCWIVETGCLVASHDMFSKANNYPRQSKLSHLLRTTIITVLITVVLE